MGLDMYLNRMPRPANDSATVYDVVNIENYIDYIEDCKNPDSKARNYTMEEWCGTKLEDIDADLLEFYRHYYTYKYYEWDTERKYEFRRIMEQVAYWRKANAIHDWFVEHVQNGVDDCDYHDEVTKEILEELLDTCERVLDASELVDGQVISRYRYTDNGKESIMEEGKCIKDPIVAMKLLPTTHGFFFGSTDYDEWYYESVKYTAKKIREILETTDFETEMLYYISSW